MGRVKLTSSGDFELSSSGVEESTEAEVDAETEVQEKTLFSLGEGTLQVLDVELEKDDVILGLLVLNIILQAGDFYE